MRAIIRLTEFDRQAKGILSPEDIGQLEEFLAVNPEAGQVIPSSGGIRKLRWKRPGMGKRGGARVIYFYFRNSRDGVFDERVCKVGERGPVER